MSHGRLDLRPRKCRFSLALLQHLQRDDYYSRDGEPPGRWAGKGAERLSLDG